MRALLLQVFCSVRSERQLMEQMRYNHLFRWFVGLSLEDTIWNHSVFSKNRDRLFENEIIESFFTGVKRVAHSEIGLPLFAEDFQRLLWPIAHAHRAFRTKVACAIIRHRWKGYYP